MTLTQDQQIEQLSRYKFGWADTDVAGAAAGDLVVDGLGGGGQRSGGVRALAGVALRFSRSMWPGAQPANTAETRVEAVFAVSASAALTEHQKRRVLARAGPVLRLLLRYTQALITQMAQTAVCNRHHTVDQQLCRWLLLSLDRLPSNRLSMTQDLIAHMLGVRREGVTTAARKLQKLGVIDYRRGNITVLDRPRLEQLCCECYAVVKRETDRLLAYVPHAPGA